MVRRLAGWHGVVAQGGLDIAGLDALRVCVAASVFGVLDFVLPGTEFVPGALRLAADLGYCR